MNALTARMGAVLAPSNYQEARDFAQMMAASDLVPRDFKGKPGNVLVAMQWGAEIGLGPLQAVQNIAVINGRPAVWGDAALALVRGHPACESVREGVEGEGDARHGWCEVTRRGEQPQRRTFSVADAKRAGLWGKSGPWQQYPDRMLQMRARGFALRDVFPDALRGVITAEEAQDIPAEHAATPVPPARGPIMDAPTELRDAEPDLLMIRPDGQEWAAPNARTWEAACLRAIGLIGDPAGLRAWARAMEDHMAAAPEAARAAVLAALEARLSAEPADDFPGDR
jgi:hypothetical protein